jgi:DNA-binding transcriptional ArsR family regulator
MRRRARVKRGRRILRAICPVAPGVDMRNKVVTNCRVDAVALALSDPIRRQILLMLRDHSATAGRIAAAFPISRPAISRHLRVLREAELVRDEAHGRERTYRLDLCGLDALEAFLRELRLENRWQRRFDALATEVHRVRRLKRRAVSASPEKSKARKPA